MALTLALTMEDGHTTWFPVLLRLTTNTLRRALRLSSVLFSISGQQQIMNFCMIRNSQGVHAGSSVKFHNIEPATYHFRHHRFPPYLMGGTFCQQTINQRSYRTDYSTVSAIQADDFDEKTKEVSRIDDHPFGGSSFFFIAVCLYSALFRLKGGIKSRSTHKL